MFDSPTPWPNSIIVGRRGDHSFVLDELDSDRSLASGERLYVPSDPETQVDGPVTLSDAGSKFLAYLEGGVRLHPYDDLTGRDWDGEQPLKGHLAIGVGRTLFDNMYTEEQMARWIVDGIEVSTALLWLKQDVASHITSVAALQEEMKGRHQLEQHQFDALVCFAFNIGKRAFANSTLLRKLRDGGPHNWNESVRTELPRWKYSRGRLVPGLLNRRNETIELFCDGDYTPQWFMPRHS